ncbi:AraC family transcriptional regulator [Clostridium estertheticum]|uniref:AraC family transcriptional regulator n=1 Tax=Clostridium estertheticum TaxID=238834 RepID=UPI001C7CF723|nr:AraC family transcriptional regulator [Clostridium estertheticum]MBX4262466.1 AraC family transcriptional regulator [Clostridium estertheticum]WLC72264.1 AraC family transcriptional regulator [Clostridium estertheticum]
MNPKYTNSARYRCLEYLKKQSVDLYLSYCGIEECDPGHSYGPTIRTEYLLHYILKGKGIYNVDSKTYNLSNHQSFIIYPNEITYYEADKEDPWTYIWIGFNGIKAETCLNYASLNKENRVSKFDCEDILLECINGILNASKLTYANDLKRESYLSMFLSAIIQEKHDCITQLEDIHDYPYQVYVEHALEFIDHNYQKNIKINDIANYIGISRSYLTNIFKKNINLSPQEYLIKYRFDRACSLLKTTTLPVSTVASQVGYDDPLTFSKVFKKFYTVSPTTYRTQHELISYSNTKGN